MNVLPRGTMLGSLEYYEIYDDFDGPKCFSAKNNLGQLFLVYWHGTYRDEKLVSWLFSPVSQKRLDALRRRNFSIREIYTSPEQCVYFIKNDFTGKNKQFELISSETIEKYNLPPESFYIEPEEIEVCSPEADWNFELRIAKKNSAGSPDSTMVTKIIDALSAIVGSLMDDESREIPKLYPLTANHGSFEVKLGTNNHLKSSIAIEQLASLLEDTSDLDSKLKNVGLDPYRLKDLLEIAQQYNLQLELKPKTYDVLSNNIRIGVREFEPLIESLKDSTTTFIDSGKVPQANDLDRVIDIVCRIVNGEKIVHDNIDGLSSKRQVQYYTDAAYCLGLLNKNLSVTSAARFLAATSTKEIQYKFLADRFESSEFGWAWMKWSKVNRMAELDESTAQNFIAECVRGLNDATSKRRSSTLATWLVKLKGHSRNYELELECGESKQS
ncbi:DUF6575 domain-containing protein [Vibrio alginolyticus]|uniref:DUF6575 domain-containing protein n=1 Tax=Vibrio alginolyticus TaxID=663 RepID=UPI0035512DFB